MFELSQDYKKVFELLEKGDQIPCFVCANYTDPAICSCVDYKKFRIFAGISQKDSYQIILKAKNAAQFESKCKKLNIEFLLRSPKKLEIPSDIKTEFQVLSSQEKIELITKTANFLVDKGDGNFAFGSLTDATNQWISALLLNSDISSLIQYLAASIK